LSKLTLVANVVRIRCNVVHWFACCSYRRLKVTIEVRHMLCPFCKSELQDGAYSGHQVIVTARKAFGYVRDCWMPLFEDGVRVWSVLPERKRCWVRTEKAESSYD
jgi:hypothetical protein